MTVEHYEQEVNQASSLEEALEIIKNTKKESLEYIDKIINGSKKLPVKEQREILFEMMRKLLQSDITLQYKIETLNQYLKYYHDHKNISIGKEESKIND